MILKIFSPKNWQKLVKKLAFFAQTTSSFTKIFDNKICF
jgi:hypothetical protein